MARKITKHTELDVYNKGFDAAMRIFELSKKFPKEETYSLTDQVRRSSRWRAHNLAEAWRKRRYEAAFVSKLSDSESEAAETQVWLQFAVKCEYIDRDARSGNLPDLRRGARDAREDHQSSRTVVAGCGYDAEEMSEGAGEREKGRRGKGAGERGRKGAGQGEDRAKRSRALSPLPPSPFPPCPLLPCSEGTTMTRKSFELRVEPNATDYGLALYRLPARGEDADESDDGWQFVVRLEGVPMRAVVEQVLATIRQAGYRPTDLARSRKVPFALSEELGVRLGCSCWP